MFRWYGWLVYTAAALLPSTLFCFVVIVFQVCATTAYMCKCTSFNSKYLSWLHWCFKSFTLSVYNSTHFYGFWNLDFFRYFIPPFCISSQMNTLNTLALEYVIAIYPLFWMVVIYLCIGMYDRGVRVVVCVWRPFHKCFGCLKGRWNPRGSVIGGFATFLLLSYSKLLTVFYISL